jgi:protein-tyrosine kinase
MSRVEEARRRAAGRDVEAHRYPDVRSVGDTAVDLSVLEDYPLERSGAERVSSVHARPTIVVPRTATSGHLGSLDPTLDGKLVGSPDTPPVVVEQYRRLASTLHHLQIDEGLKTVLVASAIPRDGKTLTITNLALTLSESYRKRVLVIDADLRRPSLHEVFRLPKTSGLGEALRSNSRPQVLELSPFLSVLPAGEVKGDPLSLLTSERFAALLDDYTAVFDWVLLDAPPVGLMPDGKVLARLAKAVVFVIGAGTTPYKLIERAISEIGREVIVGTVLNRIDEDELPGNKGYGGYNDYYSRTDTK